MKRHLESAGILVTILIGLASLWDGHVARRRNREIDDRDRRIRDLEDRLRKFEDKK